MSADYFSEIESHFALRRGKHLLFNAKDWALLKKWQEEGIPLAIIIEAIDSVFEKNESSGRKKAINSLSYCRHAVSELWKDRRDLQVGAEESVPEAALGETLAQLADDLTASGAPEAAVLPVAAEIRDLTKEKSVPKVEERLIELEEALLTAVMHALPDAEAAEIRAAVTRALGDTSRLDEATRARTEAANLRRIVRERYRFPRLTLFR